MLVDGLATLQTPGAPWSPFLAMQATVNSSFWSGLVPGNRYKGSIRARSTITESAWSDWSDLEMPPRGYCLDVPAAPTGLRRDDAPGAGVRSGQIRLRWDPVTEPEQAGMDDPADGYVLYDIWGRPDGLNGVWRHINTQASHVDTDGVESTPNVLTEPTYAFDTYPETPKGTVWQFKLRVGNRNGVFSEFGPEVTLGSGLYPDPPKRLEATFVRGGRPKLSWEAPQYNGDALLLRYEARCTTANAWESVPNGRLSHVLHGPLPRGVIRCYVRAVNTVGPSAEATIDVTVQQSLVLPA